MNLRRWMIRGTCAALLFWAVFPTTCHGATSIHVDPNRGHDGSDGSAKAPLRTLGGAIQLLPQGIKEEIIIRLAPGVYGETGYGGIDGERLDLNIPNRKGGKVRIVGDGNTSSEVVLDWPSESSPFMIYATSGNWSLENLQVGTRKGSQRQGIDASGGAILELHTVRIRTRSFSGPGLRAEHGGEIRLYGTIEINEDLHDKLEEEESFSRIEAMYFGKVRFMEKEGASLSIGNGSLSASYYGIIELGCEWAKVTSWSEQANVIAINNSGRIDFHNTATTLCAKNPRNTPIGLEDDGHVLAEGAPITILGQGNHIGIALQKASAFFCNDVKFEGPVETALMAYSGSTLLAGIVGDLGAVRASTGSTVIIEKCTGHLSGPFETDKGAQILRPDAGSTAQRNQQSTAGIPSKPPQVSPSIPIVTAPMSPIHLAAKEGEQGKVEQLIKSGVPVNLKGPNGWTPLHMAAIGGHQSLAKWLIENGANPRLTDVTGDTPSQTAMNNGHSGLAGYLHGME